MASSRCADHPIPIEMVRWNLTPSRIARSVARTGHRRLEAVLRALKDDDYRIWDDLRVETELVDHAIIGPAGVFALQCSRTRGIGPFRRPLDEATASLDNGVGAAVWQATREVVALQRRLREASLRMPVRGIVALTGVRPPKQPIDVGKVSVLGPEQLVRFLGALGDRLTTEQRFVAANVLQRDRQVRWHPSMGG